MSSMSHKAETVIIDRPHKMATCTLTMASHKFESEVKDMQKQTVEFAVETKNGIVKRIGKSSIYQPKTNYSGKGTKWFDDSKLLKSNRK